MVRKAKSKQTPSTTQQVVISAPKFETATFRIRGNVPFVSNNFGGEARAQMRSTMTEGSKSKNRKKREPKDFAKGYRESKHVSTANWGGIPATAFRNAMISACRVCGYVMTKAKLTVFVEADGFDKVDGTPLVKITKGKPRHVEHYVRNSDGSPDLRARAMWDPGWEAKVRVRYDSEQFALVDVANLLMRVGAQVGVGAGRPDSKSSGGMGWGLFEVLK